MEDPQKAEKLLQRLSPYVLEAFSQVFVPSPFLRSIEPSPWEALSFSLCSAVLAIGFRHPSLRQSSLASISSFLDQIFQTVKAISFSSDQDHISVLSNHDERLDTAKLTVSMLGFLKAAAVYPDIWTAEGKLRLMKLIREILSEEFLISVETAFSTIRNSQASDLLTRDWKRYIRHYASISQPPGAMLLQCSFMQLTLSVTASLVTKKSCQSEENVLNILKSDFESLKTTASESQPSSTTISMMVDIATQQMSLLEDSADFLRLSSAWQQRLAFAVKASALVVFLVCAILDQTVASVDTLITWVDESLSDPIQMADDRLASVVLRCMPFLARLSPGYASTLGRSLPRFIVQNMPSGPIVTIAASSLSVILQLLSEDAVISALYTLGIVLSSANAGEKVGPGGLSSNGSINGPVQLSQDDRDGTGSAISFPLGGQEDLSVIYNNVIQAIVSIAASYKDAKITALAQSMLIQKLGKINAAVDARIISEAAILALIGGNLEFKSLLRQYSRICHNSVVRKDSLISGAVSSSTSSLISRCMKRTANETADPESSNLPI